MINKGFFYLLCVAAIMGGCKKNNDGQPTTPPHYDKNYYSRQAFVIALNSTYQNYDTALKKTGLIDTLAGPGPYTTFLMDDQATSGWGLGSSLPNNIGFLLRSFIIPGDFSLKSLPYARNLRFTTMAGNHLYVSKYHAGADSATYLVNGIPLYAADISTTNGHINVVDSIIPNIERYSSVLAYVQGSKELTFLAIALRRTGLDKMLADTTKTWTLLAPSDAAFKASSDSSLNSYDSLLVVDTAKLSRILRFHILGDRYFYNDLTHLLNNTDTAKLIPILPNDSISFYYSSNTWPPGYFFLGPGNWTGNPPTAQPVGIYHPQWWLTMSDNITANGVVHEIDNILLP